MTLVVKFHKGEIDTTCIFHYVIALHFGNHRLTLIFSNHKKIYFVKDIIEYNIYDYD